MVMMNDASSTAAILSFPDLIVVFPERHQIKDEFKDVPSSVSFPVYAGPEQRFCPARVYEYSDGSEAGGVPQLIINAQNCVHCKCCSIKMPQEYINWTVPEGGGGPNYTVM